jgi:hypothetical protein
LDPGTTVEAEVTKRRIPIFVIPFILILLGLLGWTVWKQVQPALGEGEVATAQHAATATATTDAASSPASPRRRGPSPAAQKILDAYAEAAMDPAKARQQRERMLAELEAQHRAEPVDAAWAARTEHALADIARSEVMTSTGIAARDYAADCRSSTCRISASFKSASDAEDWGTFFVTGTGDAIRQAKLMIVPGPGGTAEVRVYGVRR